jgi:hypothetical protein
MIWMRSWVGSRLSAVAQLPREQAAIPNEIMSSNQAPEAKISLRLIPLAEKLTTLQYWPENTRTRIFPVGFHE